VDANGNGIRDRGEAGLANVVISNQDAVVVTDASGRYRLPRRADGVVFVSVPDGHRAVGPFWRPGDGLLRAVWPLSGAVQESGLDGAGQP
jgi:hypothetical protein